MHRSIYTERLSVEEGKLVRIINARWQGHGLDVMKEYEDGTQICRNLYLATYGGYYVAYPDELVDELHGRGLDDWSECKIGPEAMCSAYPTSREKALIIDLYPEFKYVLQKWPDDGTNAEILKALRIWKKHPEIEMLIAARIMNIAFNQNLYRLAPAKKKEIVNFIRRNLDSARKLSLQDIQTIIKHKISVNEYQAYLKFRWNCWGNGRITWEEYKYFIKANISGNGVHIYRDYIQMAKEAGHDVTDPFWRFPSDLQKAHEKVMREVDHIREMHRLALQRDARHKEKEKLENYRKRIEKYLCYNGMVDGYSIYIPTDPCDWRKQASELNQCIVCADYMGKVADGKCLIVFISKDNAPVATAEIKPGKKLGQFYGNELDRSNCLPPAPAVAAFHTWLRGVKMGAAI